MAKTKDPSQPVRFFKWGDYAQEGAHLAAAAAIMVAVGFWAGPLTLACCAAGAGLLTLGGGKLADVLVGKIFNKREIKPGDAEGLGAAMDDFTAMARLQSKPSLYDFSLNKAKLKDNKDNPAAPAQMQRVFNAAATGINKPVVIISEPLLKALQPPETRAVIGHEFAHLGSDHIRLGLLSGWMQATTMFTAMFGLGGAVVSQGWLIGALSIAGCIGVAHVGHKMMPKNEDRYARDGTPRPEVVRAQVGIWAVQEVLSIGLLAIPNPVAVLTAVAIEHGFFWSANMVNKSLSRRHEFQADRGAVAMGANPLALITSLRKLERALELNEPAIAKSRNWREGPFYMRAYRMAVSVLKTHPDTQRRCQRLAAMAARQGYSAEDIETAMRGPVDETNLIPVERDEAATFDDGTVFQIGDDLTPEEEKKSLTIIFQNKWPPLSIKRPEGAPPQGDGSVQKKPEAKGPRPG